MTEFDPGDYDAIVVVVAAPRVIEHLTTSRTLLDTQGDHVIESAVTELFEDGEVQRHVRRMQRIYHARRDVMTALLKTELGDAVTLTVPAGGTALWVRVAPTVDVGAWCQASAEQQVLVESGDRFSFEDQPLPFIRVGFVSYREPELADAVRRLADALKTAQQLPTAVAALG